MLGRSRPRAVLVVDDDPDIRKVVAANLAAEGIKVHTAANGYEAQAQALKLSPDLIILDVGLPGRDGLQVLAALRGHPDTANIPVVLLTARTSDTDIWEGWKAGAAYYLTKPFNPDELLHFVHQLFDTSTTR